MPGLRAGCRILSVATGPNASGYRGFARASVLVECDATALPAEINPSLRPEIHIGSGGLAVLFPGGTPAILAPVAGSAGTAFQGAAEIGGQNIPVSLWLHDPPDADGSFAPNLAGRVLLGGGTPVAFDARWAESPPSGNIYLCQEAHPNGDAASNLKVVSFGPVASLRQDDFSPCIVEMSLPRFIADRLDGGEYELQLNGQNVDLVERPSLLPAAPPLPSGWRSYAVASGDGDSPRVFALADGLEGRECCPAACLDEGTGLSFVIQPAGGGDAVIRAGITVNPAPAPARFPAHVSQMPWDSNGNGFNIMAAPQRVRCDGGGDPEPGSFEGMMYAWYRILFPGHGARMLAKARELHVEIRLEGLWFDFDNWDVTHHWDRDRQLGRDPLVRIDDGDLTPPGAAQALYSALYDLFYGSWGGQHVRWAVAREENPIVGDEDMEALQELATTGQMKFIADTLAVAELAGQVSLSLVNEAGDWALSLPEAVDQWNEGRHGAATVQALATVLPFVSGRVARLGGRLSCFGPGGDLFREIGPEGLRAIESVCETCLDVNARAARRVEAMRVLRPAIESGDIDEALIRSLWESGHLVLPEGACYKELAKGLGPRPAGCKAHHFLPVQTGGKLAPGMRNLQLDFLQRGLDPNDASFGLWVPDHFHDMILHGNQSRWGPGGPWNFQWVKFFETNPGASAIDVLGFMNNLKAKIRDTSKTIDEIDWEYFPET
jgi:hypothetical protein